MEKGIIITERLNCNHAKKKGRESRKKKHLRKMYTEDPKESFEQGG